MKYATDDAFRTALEARIKQGQTDSAGVSRLRKRIVFERLLARLFAGGQAVAELVSLGHEEGRGRGDVDLLGAKILLVEGSDSHRQVIDGSGFEPGHAERCAVVVRRDACAALAARLEAGRDEQLDRDAGGIEPLTL